jgi:predicted regulator of Ras-like GTPase activity (Roadblock/LC7/MglB family)
MAQEDHWALIDEDLARTRVLLYRLVRKSSARSVLLTDVSGHLLTFVGDCPEIDLTGFLALCAGDYAASREMAAMLGEETFQALYHQGGDHQIYITSLGRRALLILLFNHESTLGLVRWAVKKYHPELHRAVGDAVRAAHERAGVLPVGVDDPLAQSVDDALDAFFDA